MVKKPRNDAQIKVEHVAEFVGKQGAMRDDLIEVEPTNIKGLMASVDQFLELVQLISALLTSGWNGFYSDEKAMTCLKKMRAEVDFVVTCVPHLWSLDLSLMLADC